MTEILQEDLQKEQKKQEEKEKEEEKEELSPESLLDGIKYDLKLLKNENEKLDVEDLRECLINIYYTITLLIQLSFKVGTKEENEDKISSMFS